MNFSKLLPYLAAIAVFYLVAAITFSPQFSGKTLSGGDAAAYQGASKELRDYGEELGERQNWTGTSFAGMPTYQIAKINEGNTLRYFTRPLRGFLPGPAGVFFAGMLCAFLLFIVVGVNPWLSIAGAVGIALATNNLVLWGAGHSTKVQTIFYLPLITAGAIAAFRRQYLLGGLLFALGMGLATFSNHAQMLFYFGITMPIYGIAKLVEAVRKNELPHFAKAAGALVIGLLIGVGSGANIVVPTQEYTSETMRGGQVLETPLANNLPQATGTASPAKTSGGLDWDYAMQWSNGFKDAVATYVPNAAGGGTQAEVSSDSEFAKTIRSFGFPVRGKTTVAPLYHGSLPFTEGPIYLGAVVWALFIFGLFTANRALAAWLAGGTLLILMMAAGTNLESFNRFLFDNLPLLNKFRTPNSALSVTTFMMLTLGIIGVHTWVTTLATDRARATKQLKLAGIVAGTLGLVVAVILPLFLDFNGAGDARVVQQYNQAMGGQMDTSRFLDALEATRRAEYSADAWRSFLFVGLIYGALFLFLRGTVNTLIMAAIVGGLLVADFAGINGRYLTKEDWRPVRSVKAGPTPTAADQQILQDTDLHYRVLNTTTNVFNDAQTSYFHRSIGGYSAVKLRRYQDVIDGYLGQSDQDVINMLNTKYFIVKGQDGLPQARQNPGAFGPAWLVSDIEVVNNNDAEFAALGTVADLRTTAIVHEDYANAVAGLTPDGEGQITITQYQPDELVYDFNSSSDQLVVFSEIWYGPDLGWEAYIDGQPAELIRTNYLLRGLRVPAGQHEIKLVFEPSSYSLGVTLSLICSLLIILGLVAYGAYAYLNRDDVENTAVPVEDMPRESSK